MADGKADPRADSTLGDRSREDASRPRHPLWFLAEREAFLQRFVLRTLLRPPRFRRGPRPRAFER